MTVTDMDMLLQTVLTKYCPQAHQHTIEAIPIVGMVDPPVGMIDPHLGIIATPGIHNMIIKRGTGSVTPYLTPTISDTGVTIAMTPAEVGPDHFIDLHATAPHATAPPVHTATAMTCHIAGLQLIGIFPEMTADLTHANPNTLQTSTRIILKLTHHTLEKQGQMT